MFSHAIVRRPARNLVKGITTGGLGQPDYELALKQHDAYIDALRRCGLAVSVMDADEDYADGMFVEDTALVMPGVAVITRPGAASRQGETDSIKKQLAQFFGQIEVIEAPGTVDGGDIMMVGRHFFVGLSERTNETGAGQMIEYLNKHGYDGSTIPVGEGLHFKSSISYLENNHIIVTSELAGNSELAKFNAIEVDESASYSANSVWVNGHVLVPAGFDETSRSIAALGYEVIELDMSEFRKLDGGLSCLSLRF